MNSSKKAILLLAAAACLAVFGGDRTPLWPEGAMPDAQNHQIAAMTDVSGAAGFDPDAHRSPFIEWLDAAEGAPKTDACMILISGGSYNCCCDVGLVDGWHRRLSALGVTCVNLVYRTPRPKGLPIWQSAWEDGQRAVRLVRREAAKRGFNPEKIGVMSMSAGSHLATLLATSSQTPAYAPVDDADTIPCHINWACTFAIAYGMTDGAGAPNSRDGDAVDAKLDSVFRFDGKTCPMWMSHGGRDPYSPASSAFVYRRLRSMGVPAELHLYPDKSHGAFGFDRAVEFMRQMEYLGPLEKEVSLMSRYADDSARASVVREPVWPDGKMPSVQTNQCTPYIEWHFPKVRKTAAIQIAYSGGSYKHNSPDGFEVAPVRRYLNGLGMTVVTLKYRTPRPLGALAKHTTAWQDLQRTVRIVRSRAETYGLDPDSIGIMGSSAGGHLTLMGATSSRRRAYWPVDDIDKNVSCGVQWAVAVYPAYALTDGADRYNTTGGNEDWARLVPEFSFDLSTPPILFLHGDADGWAAMNSVKAWEQLRRMGIQGELHTLALRKHCFQKAASPGTGSYTWMDRIGEFLDAKGFSGRTAPPKISVFASFIRATARQRGVSLDKAAKMLYDLGVRGYDIGPDEKDVDELAATCLKPINYYFFPRMFAEDNGAADCRRCLDKAVKQGVPRVMVVPSNFTKGGDEEAEFAKIVSSLKMFVAEGAKRGITITVEDFGGTANAASHAKYLKRMLDEVPGLCFALDSGNLYYAGRGDDILELMEYAKTRVAHIHLKDQTAENNRKYASLGLGAVPNDKIVKAMHAAGYDGWYTLENPVGDVYTDTLRQIAVLKSWLSGR